MGDIQRSGTPSLATLLTTAREDVGLTRRELAERSGLSYPYVSQLETGYRGPSPEAMQRLTEVLGVPVDAMVAAMTERDTPSPRMNKPAPRSAPAPGPAAGQQSRWIVNPAWAPTQPTDEVDAGSSLMRRRSLRSPAARPVPAETADMRQASVTHAARADTVPAPPPPPATLVAEIVARLGELPPAQRMAALADIQNLVVRTVVADAASADPD